MIEIVIPNFIHYFTQHKKCWEGSISKGHKFRIYNCGKCFNKKSDKSLFVLSYRTKLQEKSDRNLKIMKIFLNQIYLYVVLVEYKIIKCLNVFQNCNKFFIFNVKEIEEKQKMLKQYSKN